MSKPTHNCCHLNLKETRKPVEQMSELGRYVQQFKVEEPISRSPESLATRDFSASGISSRTGTGDWDSKFEDAQVDEAESTLKEALSLNYEEARALLGRLEYQRGNFDAALQVFYGIDIRSLSPRMITAISDRTLQRNSKAKREK
ncbi:unnamed protein product [Lactuca virosa]|uniref:Uncharacterized protein n=1 Tax=Lactuca virosa TaxID=75947 RepID=A0AAU9M5C6_9ASTR|nr:unnamed protein product [Lactuca virosa]